MDLSNFVTFDKKEYLLLNIAVNTLDIVEDTHSKPQKTLGILNDYKHKDLFHSMSLSNYQNLDRWE